MTDKPKRIRLDRANKRLLAAHIEHEAYKQVKSLAASHNLTTDMMIRAGLSLLFRELKKPVPPEFEVKISITSIHKL